MKVGFDIRGLSSEDHYGSMMLKVIKKLIEVDNKNEYIVYTNKSIGLGKQEKVISAKPGNALDDFRINKDLKDQQFGLMVFFDYRVPLFYKEDFIVVIPSLKESFFMGKEFLQREVYGYYMKKTIARAKKIICFEKYTAGELNERLNVNEGKIQVMPPFFDINKTEMDPMSVQIDIKAKYNLHNDYLIYDGGNGANKNIEKLIKTFKRLKKSGENIHLFMLGEAVSKDTDIRDMVIAAKLQDRVEFVSHINPKEEYFYYTQSKGVVFTSIYESFPFHLKKAVQYGVPMLSSDIGPVREFMGKHIDYFNPKSSHDMEDAVKKFLKKNKKVDYTKILADLTLPKTIKQFYTIMMKP